jgi:solute carrier family 35, member E1
MAAASGTEKFPELSPLTGNDVFVGRTSPNSFSPVAPQLATNGTIFQDHWQPRRDSRQQWSTGPLSGHARHGRQKSLSEAIRTIRTRRGSVSQNAHELADALRAPVSPKLIVSCSISFHTGFKLIRSKFLCGIWYMTSVMSNTSSKAILTAFPKPVTLTVIQFAFVSSWCIFLARLARLYPRLKVSVPALKFGIRPPTRDLIMTTLPLTLFQIGGHILSSDAMARIPVSLVHTIKGLSPLFTVLAYRFIYNIQYSVPTYLSLIPLTLGVVMACSADFTANFLGLVYAFGSAILFVTQNIVSKNLFNDAAQAEADGQSAKNRKPDKLNLLCYSSGLAFCFTAPIWLWSEGFTLLSDFLQDASLELTEKPGSYDHGRLLLEFFFNGTFHFAQNLVAFQLLSMVSPVTYSVASLIKRVFVISFAIIWFGKPMSQIQGYGFLLTFLGLYLYDRTSDADKADRKAQLMKTLEKPLLPVVSEARAPLTTIMASPQNLSPISGDDKRNDANGPGITKDGNGSGWLPRGTKQEETWQVHDMGRKSEISVN